MARLRRMSSLVEPTRRGLAGSKPISLEPDFGKAVYSATGAVMAGPEAARGRAGSLYTPPTMSP